MPGLFDSTWVRVGVDVRRLRRTDTYPRTGRAFLRVVDVAVWTTGQGFQQRPDFHRALRPRSAHGPFTHGSADSDWTIAPHRSICSRYTSLHRNLHRRILPLFHRRRPRSSRVYCHTGGTRRPYCAIPAKAGKSSSELRGGIRSSPSFVVSRQLAFDSLQASQPSRSNLYHLVQYREDACQSPRTNVRSPAERAASPDRYRVDTLGSPRGVQPFLTSWEHPVLVLKM